MNADIPFLRCWVRLPIIADADGVEEAYAFAIQSCPGRCLGFHVMLASGAHYRNVPIHALCLTPGSPAIPLGDCQLWDCFSYRPEVHVFSYLQDHEAVCHLRSGPRSGTYLFTVDWLPDSPERPGWTMRPEQNKCAHVLALDDGNLCAMPTNRIAWKDGYFIGSNPDPRSRGYRVQEEVWRAEDSRFDVSRDSGMYYEPLDGRLGPLAAPAACGQRAAPERTPEAPAGQ